MVKLELEQKETYKARIQRFFGYLENVDPLWITKRSWVEDLMKFEIGDDFYYTVMVSQDPMPKNKGDFYVGLLVYASINFKKKFGKKREDIESGFKIEADVEDYFEKEIHKSFLGYYWWLAIYKQAHKAKQFTESEEAQLQVKKKKFMKIINRWD